MTFSGNVNTLDPPGAVNKATFKSDFLAPVAADIEALQVGSSIVMSGTPWTIAEIGAAAVTLVNYNGATRPLSLIDAYRATAGERPWFTASDLGLVGDGVTDDAPALQRAYDAYAAIGGAVFMLRSQPGKSFHFKGSPRGGSNISTVFFSPHTPNRYAGLKLAGSLTPVDGVTGIRLASNATAAGNTLALDMSPIGGGVVSAVLAVGDSIQITGLRDSCGTPLQTQDLRITAINDGTSTITVSPVLGYAYEVAYTAGDYEAAQGSANVTLISKLVTAQASSNIAANINLWPINLADVGKFTEGDWVVAIDESTAADVAGTSSQETRIQITRIAPSVSGDAAASVRLLHNLERSYTTAKFARLIKITPILNASIQGGTVEFTEAPGDTQTHSFEIQYGVDCVLSGCNVPNTDIFGTKGDAFRIWRSFNSGADGCLARGARYYASGEGYWLHFAWSTSCWSRGGAGDAMRHGVVMQGSTNCTATDPFVEYPHQAPLDFHGVAEYGCRIVNPTCTASTSHESIAGVAPVGIAFGNQIHLAGSHKCGVIGGRMSGFKGAEGTHKGLIEFRVPSTGCYVRGTEFNDIGMLLAHADLAGFGSLISSGHRIEGVSVDGCAGWLGYLEGQVNGSVLNTLQDISISDCSFRNVNKLFKASFITEIQMYENEIDEVTVDASNTYFLDADTCPSLTIVDNKLTGIGRFLKLSTCTGMLITDNVSAGQTFGTVYNDVGSNSGEWSNNRWPGITASTTRNGSILTEGPRGIGTVTLADDSTFTFKPSRAQGVIQVWSSGASTVFGLARFIGAGTADCDLFGSVSSANVEATTGVLAGTTGNDTKFTISAVNTGTLYFENRTGSSVTVDYSIS